MIIMTEDTDVFVIGLSVYHQISGNMYIQCGIKNRLRHIDIAKDGQSLSEETCKALQGFMHLQAVT